MTPLLLHLSKVILVKASPHIGALDRSAVRSMRVNLVHMSVVAHRQSARFLAGEHILKRAVILVQAICSPKTDLVSLKTTLTPMRIIEITQIEKLIVRDA